MLIDVCIIIHSPCVIVYYMHVPLYVLVCVELYRSTVQIIVRPQQDHRTRKKYSFHWLLSGPFSSAPFLFLLCFHGNDGQTTVKCIKQLPSTVKGQRVRLPYWCPCQSICLFACLSVCIYMYDCLSACRYVCLTACLSVQCLPIF